MSMRIRHERPLWWTVNALLNGDWQLFKRKHVFWHRVWTWWFFICIGIERILKVKCHKHPLLRNGPFWSLDLIKAKMRGYGCNNGNFLRTRYFIHFPSQKYSLGAHSRNYSWLPINFWPCFFRIKASLGHEFVSSNTSDSRRYFANTGLLFTQVCAILQNTPHSTLL
jgi:hypothetical protein